jgi:hypothetical protein
MNPLLYNVGGRPKIYGDDILELMKHETVQSWVRGLREGPGRITARYHLASYLRWRDEKGLEGNPDLPIEECLDGNNRTLIDHLKVAQEYCTTAPQFEGDKKSTRVRNLGSIRSFYMSNYVALPAARLRIDTSNESRSVTDEVTASLFLALVSTVLNRAKLSPRDKAIIVLMLQTGNDDSTFAEVFNYVAFPQLAKAFGTEDYTKWESSLCPIQVFLKRTKVGTVFYTFVDVDGVEVLKDWLALRERFTGRRI